VYIYIYIYQHVWIGTASYLLDKPQFCDLDKLGLTYYIMAIIFGSLLLVTVPGELTFWLDQLLIMLGQVNLCCVACAAGKNSSSYLHTPLPGGLEAKSSLQTLSLLWKNEIEGSH
jgi:hypothetical protein